MVKTLLLHSKVTGSIPVGVKIITIPSQLNYRFNSD
jgi:hypothetical protein